MKDNNCIVTYTVAGIGERRKFFDDDARRDAINYICNPQKAVYTGCRNVSCVENAAEEMKETAQHFGKDSGKRIRHSIISFDENSGVTAEEARNCAEEIIDHYKDFQIVYAVHGNTDNTHVHLVMNQISFTDGQRYQGKKKDFYDFLQQLRDVTHRPVMYVK